MASYEHGQLARAINELEAEGNHGPESTSWLRAEGHLQVLRNNAVDKEVILYACSRVTFIHTVITRESDVTPPDTDDLLDWHSSAIKGRAGYSWTLVTGNVQVAFSETNPWPRTMKHSQNLVFGRRMEGMHEPYYYELLQEFTHTAGIHWRDEQQAYCRIDENGDIEPVVSITKSDDEEGTTLITCKREPLEQYVAATGSILVRFFDFEMMRRDRFKSWGGAVTERNVESEHFFYAQGIHPEGYAWTRGTQILPVTLPRDELFRPIIEPRSRRAGRQYASFITLDRRSGKTLEVSTNPADTTNYFQASHNSLPYEVSPAFFRAEVLSKYKVDRDKYTIDEASRLITCRGAWSLKSYDINDAGQVHAYICDLRNLPYREQLHWESYNEEPKGTISERAYENDIQGTWSSHVTALERVLYMLHRWVEESPDWWQIPDEDLLVRVNTPVSASRDEWGRAFLELCKTVIEGFRVTPIRTLLRQEGIDFDKSEQSLALLEKLLAYRGNGDGHPTRLDGLRQAHLIRSKVQSHSGGKEADQMATNALKEHGTYRGHFEHVCNLVAGELEQIEEAFKSTQGNG